MTTEILEKFIHECLLKIELLPDGSYKKEKALEGIRYLRKASVQLNNLNENRNGADAKLSQGLTLILFSLYG